MTERNFAFEQVECSYPLVDEAVTEWAGGKDARREGRWRIQWSMDESRDTGIAGLAYYADQWDDEAEVMRLE